MRLRQEPLGCTAAKVGLSAFTCCNTGVSAAAFERVTGREASMMVISRFSNHAKRIHTSTTAIAIPAMGV